MAHETDEFKDALKDFQKSVSDMALNLLTALSIWLFGTLVFIPLANSVDASGRTTMICGLIVTSAFVIFILRAIPPLKSSIEVFSSLLAIKYSKRKGLSFNDSKVLFKYTMYIAVSLFLCILFLPLLTTIHPALYGLTLILVLIWIFFLFIRILSILSPKILLWLKE